MEVQYKMGNREQIPMTQMANWDYAIVRQSWSNNFPDHAFSNCIILKHPVHGIINFHDKQPTEIRAALVEIIQPGDSAVVTF